MGQRLCLMGSEEFGDYSADFLQMVCKKSDEQCGSYWNQYY